MPLSTIVTLIKALLHAFVRSIFFDRHTNDNDLANPRLDGSPPSVVYGTVRLMLICCSQPRTLQRDVSGSAGEALCSRSRAHRIHLVATMVQYNPMPSPGPYVPPGQGTPAQQQGAQQPPSYQPNATTYGGPNQSQKGVAGFGQMMNQRLEQAVTTGKPMLNKLGKTISSKLGNKPPGGPPQHLQSYHNYQSHYGQQNQTQSYQQPQGQAFSPQSQSQQWGQQQHQPPSQTPTAYPSSQQSPHQQFNNQTPVSGHSAQNNYFPQQTNQAPNYQSYAPQSPLAGTTQTASRSRK